MKTYIVYELFGSKVTMSENELFRYYNEESIQIKVNYNYFRLWIKELFLYGLLEVNKSA